MKNAWGRLKRILLLSWITFKKNIVTIVLFSFGYGIAAYFVRAEIIAGRGDIRPTIFLPSLAAIVFGPLIGGFVGGLGNIIYDIINKVIVEHEALKLKHVVGFIANFTGASIVGMLSKKLDWRRENRVFSYRMMKIYIENTVASILGMGFIVALIIGLGLLAIGDINSDIAMKLIAGIAFWNSISSLILIIVQPLYVWLEKRAYIKRVQIRQKTKSVRIVEETRKTPVKIVRAEFLGDGAVEKEWGLLQVSIKNLIGEHMKYRLELIAPDLIIPSVKYSTMIPPDGTDDITFSVYPLDSGERELKLYVKPWPRELSKQKEILEKGYVFSFRLRYTARKDEPEAFRAFLSIISIILLLALAIKSLFSLLSPEETAALLIALIIFSIEIALIVIWYIWKKWRMHL